MRGLELVLNRDRGDLQVARERAPVRIFFVRVRPWQQHRGVIDLQHSFAIPSIVGEIWRA
jgi:hypothetical protein